MRNALDWIGRHEGVRVSAVSRVFQTRAVGGPAAQSDFLNAAARLETSLSPLDMLALLQAAEERLGRERHERWGPRTIDLDLLLYDQLVLDTPRLVLPHPWMAVRRFVLVPAVEVGSDMLHPPTGWTLDQLMHHLDGPYDYIALAGPPGAGKTFVVMGLGKRFGCHSLTSRVVESLLNGEVSTGNPWTTEVEFLRFRTEQLATAGFPRHKPAVSDFWFDQSLVYARRRLRSPWMEQYEETWSAARQRVVLPKLLILLEARDKQPPVIADREPRADPRDELYQELARQAGVARQTPLLKMLAADEDRVMADVWAAMQAMQEPVI